MKATRCRFLRWLAGPLLLLVAAAVSAVPSPPAALPEFRNRAAEAWLNSPPLSAAGLRGKVVLIELFTTG